MVLLRKFVFTGKWTTVDPKGLLAESIQAAADICFQSLSHKLTGL